MKPSIVIMWIMLAFLLGPTMCFAASGDQEHIASLIEDLRSDEIRWNAIEAMEAIGKLDAPPLTQLEQALDSADYQQRQLAAQLLWEYLHPRYWIVADAQDGTLPGWRGQNIGHATSRLIEVTVEGLQSDQLPIGRTSRGMTTTYGLNAADGFRMFVRHAYEARSQLELGLGSVDYQQRFLCALVLGFGGVSESAQLAFPVLIPHLRNNDIREDAKWVTHALFGFGLSVLPDLIRVQNSDDLQQRELVRLLILDLTDPPRTQVAMEERQHLHSITRTVFDPAIRAPLGECMFWIRDLNRDHNTGLDD